jgi:hypothetical protein
MSPAKGRRMIQSILGKPSTLLALAALAATFATGCAHTVDFTVLRPAMLNIQPSGGTVTVGDIEANGHPEAAADVANELRTRVAHSLNPKIRLLAEGGAVVVDGGVLANGYQEHTETVSQTCTRTVDDGTDANGNAQSHTETYDCSYDVTIGVGTARIGFRVLDRATHAVLFAQSYDRSGSVTSPSSSDVVGLMHGLRASTVEQFAKVILPYQEVVTEKFKDCDSDARCKKGFEMIKAGNYPAADALFTQVIGPYTAGAVPSENAKQISEAFYDRGVTRAYQQRYAEAEADLSRALVLQPTQKRWPEELASVQAMERERQTLREQGAVP